MPVTPTSSGSRLTANADDEIIVALEPHTTSRCPLIAFDYTKARISEIAGTRALPTSEDAVRVATARQACEQRRSALVGIAARSEFRRVGVEVVLACRPASGGLGGTH